MELCLENLYVGMSSKEEAKHILKFKFDHAFLILLHIQSTGNFLL